MHRRELVSMFAVPIGPLASLLNDVVVLGEKLAGDVERHESGPCLAIVSAKRPAT
jgi:hypothetical protein